MTLQASETQTTPMQMEISCPFAPPVVSHHSGFYEIYEKPLGALRPTGDGRFRSDAEQTAPGEAGSTMTTTYAMTLRARDCPDDMPARGLVHYMGGGVYAEPSYSSPVIGQPPLGMRVVYEERATMIGGEIWFRVRVPGMQGTAWVPGSEVACTRPAALPPARPIRVVPSDIPFAKPNPPVDCDTHRYPYVDTWGVFLGWVIGSGDPGYQRCLNMGAPHGGARG